MHQGQLRGLIRDTLQLIDMNSEEAVELLLGTAAVESNLGYYIRQVGGPARGIFQMEPATEADLWENYIGRRRDLLMMMAGLLGYATQDISRLEYDLRYQIVMARLHYLRVPEALPKTLEGMARYWKKYYNTPGGKGTEEKYIRAYKTLIGSEHILTN